MNSDTLFSAHWHRTKHHKPRLAADTNMVRHVYRDKPYWILQRRATNAFHRLDAATYALVDELDGNRTISEIWEQAIVEREHTAPTQDEWLNVLAELQNAELLTVDSRVSAESLFERRKEGRERLRKDKWQNPLFLRFALHDPDAWLSRLTPLAKVIFSRTSLALWLLLMIAGFIALMLSGASILDEITASDFPSGRSALILLLVYPPLKFFHELAHALAVKRRHGEVHEVGIALMVLMPLPYVDASASASFVDKKDRMLVAAAGIFVELGFAAVGVLLWAIYSGVVADVGLALFLVGGMSTLLVNGNPLLRFDAYFVLSEILEIPNLASRSKKASVASLKALISGKPSLTQSVDDRAEKHWLVGYGYSAAIYRTGLMLWIAWWLSDRFLIFGLILAVYAIVMNLIVPLFRGLAAMRSDTNLHNVRSIVMVAVMPVCAISLVLWLPLPHAYVVQGVIWLPDEAIVRVKGSCEITSSSVKHGQAVEIGQSLFNCLDTELPLNERELLARSDQISTQLSGVAIRNPSEYGRLKAELRANEFALREVRERMSSGFHKAQLKGWFDAPGTVSVEGRSHKRGEIAGYVVPKYLRTVRVALEQSIAGKLDTKLRRIELLATTAKQGTQVYETSVLNRTLRASHEVPSAALSTIGGGEHQADPSGDGRQLVYPVFNLELEWPKVAGAAPVGAHVPVRFVHPPSPLGGRIADAIRRAVTEHGSV